MSWGNSLSRTRPWQVPVSVPAISIEGLLDACEVDRVDLLKVDIRERSGRPSNMVSPERIAAMIERCIPWRTADRPVNFGEVFFMTMRIDTIRSGSMSAGARLALVAAVPHRKFNLGLPLVRTSPRLSAHLFDESSYAQKRAGLGRAIRVLRRVRGTDIPPATLVGCGLTLPHTGHGWVWNTALPDRRRATLFPNAMVVRARPWLHPREDPGRVTIESLAIIGVGAVIAPADGDLVVARGTMLGANSVLTVPHKTLEVWAGRTRPPRRRAA